MISLLIVVVLIVAVFLRRVTPIPGLRTRRDRGAMVAGLGFIAAGALHFIAPGDYLPMMPPVLPYPVLLIYLSGAFEMLGGLGLLVPRARLWAAWGLIALLVAVFPANVYVAYAKVRLEVFPGAPDWAYWARLPFQAVFIVWIAWAGRIWPKETSPVH